MKLLGIFIVLNVVNVIIQTIKSIATVKCGKAVASIVNAVAYGLYTVVMVYMVCELPLWLKVVIVGGANLVGVFVVKLIEEKSRKDKLWKIECTVPKNQVLRLQTLLESCGNTIPYNYIDIEKYYIFNFYCSTQKQSTNLKNLFKQCNFPVKYFVTESKVL